MGYWQELDCLTSCSWYLDFTLYKLWLPILNLLALCRFTLGKRKKVKNKKYMEDIYYGSYPQRNREYIKCKGAEGKFVICTMVPNHSLYSVILSIA